MKSNKYPGSDGITIEFYKYFCKDVQNLVINSLNDGFGFCKLSDRLVKNMEATKKRDKNNLND